MRHQDDEERQDESRYATLAMRQMRSIRNAQDRQRGKALEAVRVVAFGQAHAIPARDVSTRLPQEDGALVEAVADPPCVR